MVKNRAINGAANPGDTAAGDASAQRSQLVLSTNESLAPAQDRLFEPNLETIPGISKRRTTAAVDAGSESWPDYGSHIPVGPKASENSAMRYPWTDEL